MTTTGLQPPHSDLAVRRRVRSALLSRGRGPGDVWNGVALGAVGAMVAALGSWIPSFWGDEAASVLSAERPLPSLFMMLGNVDAVHGTYYLALHFWIEAFGASPFSVRLPSALATGLATAGIFFVARELTTPGRVNAILAGRSVAVVTAVVFIALPRVIGFGDETRAYAFSAAIACWSMYLLVRLLRSSTTSARWWIAYGVLFAAGVYAFLYSGLIVAVHALVLLQARPTRAAVKRWALAIGGAVLLASPVIVYGLAQHGQVGFLSRRDTVTPHSILVTTWFGTAGFALVAWLLIAVAVVAFVLERIRRRAGADFRIRDGLTRAPGSRDVDVTWVALTWGAGPLVILMLGNIVVADFSPRYLSFSTPAIALLMGLGIVRLATLAGRRSTLVRLVATGLGAALVVSLAAPLYLESRTPYAKNDTGWQSVSAVVGEHASAGDAVVFDESTRPSRLTRLAEYTYPEGFAGLRDVTLRTPYAETPSWHDSVYSVSEALSLGRFHGVATVWVVEYGADRYGLTELEGAGFAVDESYGAHGARILKLTRSL